MLPSATRASAASKRLPAPRNRRLSAFDLWKAARHSGDQGRSADAVVLCERALSCLRQEPNREITTASGETADQQALYARILITLSYHRAELGHIGPAQDLLDIAVQVDPSARPFAEVSRGMLLIRTGRSDEAINHFDTAVGELRHGRSGGSALDLARTFLNRGLLHMTAGRLNAAHDDTQSALDALGNADRPDDVEFMAAHNLGYIQFLQGDLPDALRTMSEAADRTREVAIGVPALDRSRVLLAAGLVSEAREFADRALADFTVNRATADLAEALQVRAEIDLATGDPGAARWAARRAAKIAAKRGNDRGATVAAVIELRADAVRRGTIDGSAGARRNRALRDASRAGELANRLSAMGLTEDALATRLLEVEAELDAEGAAAEDSRKGTDGDANEGAASGFSPTFTSDDVRGTAPVDSAWRATAARGERSGNLAIRLHARLLSARLDLVAGAPAAGLIHVRRGLDDLARFQAKFGSQDLQSGAAVHGRQLGALGLRTAVETGSPAAILQWLERSRAVTTRLAAVRPPSDPALAADLGSLRVAFDRARQAALAGRRDPALEHRVTELRHRIRSRSWTAGGSGAVDRPVSLSAVRRALAAHPGTSVLALFHGTGHDHALAITARRARYLRLGEMVLTESRSRRVASDLDLLADARLPRPLSAVAAGSLKGTLGRLSESLVEPVMSHLDDGPVLVVDAGPTAALPWSQLPALRGRIVSVTSSVSRAIAGLSAPEQPAHANGVLAVAGPDVGNGEKEARAVAALHRDATVLTGDEATGRGVLDGIAADGLVHIAAHGHHEPDNPLFSGLMLADGLLFGYDVAPNPQLPAQIVLSSCDVGRTHERPGGEPLGLVAALVRSGVRTVIAATSRISDEVAEPAMIGYHRHLLAGLRPAAALAAALHDLSCLTELPAPLTCFGGSR